MFTARTIVTKDDVVLFTESMGDDTHETILLIMGAMNPGIFWYDTFCEALVAKGFRVIRYDHRDTGRSDTVEFAQVPYTLDTLTDDALAILDAYGLTRVHICGISMGGYIAQLIAIHHCERVQTLTLIATTADQRPYMDATMGNIRGTYLLPFPDTQLLDYINNAKKNPPMDKESQQAQQLFGWKMLLGNISSDDFAAVTDLINYVHRLQDQHPYAAFQHALAVDSSPDRLESVAQISAPTLIVHGSDDICFPAAHAKFLEAHIPHAVREEIAGMGHMFTPSEAPQLALRIAQHCKQSSTV